MIGRSPARSTPPNQCKLYFVNKGVQVCLNGASGKEGDPKEYRTSGGADRHDGRSSGFSILISANHYGERIGSLVSFLVSRPSLLLLTVNRVGFTVHAAVADGYVYRSCTPRCNDC